MSTTDVLQRMNRIPYNVLYEFINESYTTSQFEKFNDRAADAMKRHDPKGFLIDEILKNILYGDVDMIIDFLQDHLQTDY